MSHNQEIESTFAHVRPRPEEDRVALAYKILSDMRRKNRADAPRNTLDRAIGITKGSTPPPDDETVKKWIEDHRLRKYG
jgi:hypothetical protein